MIVELKAAAFIILPLAIIFASIGCYSNQSGQTVQIDGREQSSHESSPKKVNSEWKRFAKNEWYELHELRVTDDQSIIDWKIVKNDAQLAIGMVADVGVLAKSRGFTHFRMLESESEIHPESFKKIRHNENRADELLVVEFYTAEPPHSDEVYDVETMIMLANQRDLENSD